MGKKTKKYLNDLNLKFSPYKEYTLASLSQYMSPNAANNLLNEFYSAIKIHDMQKIYTIKNRTLEAALILSSSYDYYIYEQIGDWIERNSYLFKGKILDVGCDCGIMTCLIAHLLPKHTITAIDINPNSIRCAKELAAKLNITNVNFICCSLDDIKEKFDTIFEMRILHENIDISTSQLFFSDFEEKVEHFGEECNKIVNETSNAIKDDGTFISVIRCSFNELFTAYLLKQNEYGFDVDFKREKQLSIQEISDKNDFQIIVSKKRNQSISQEIELFNFLLSKFKGIWDTPKTEGFQGDFKFYLRSENFLRGILVYEGDNLVMKYALYSTDDPTTLYMVCKSRLHSEDYVGAYDISDKGFCLEDIDRIANDCRAQKKKVVYMEK